jgi:hypothetical protein
MTALARASSNCKRQTRPLVREGAPTQQTRNCQTIIKIWSYAPEGCFIPRQTDRLSVGRNIRLRLSNLHLKCLFSIHPTSVVTPSYLQAAEEQYMVCNWLKLFHTLHMPILQTIHTAQEIRFWMSCWIIELTFRLPLLSLSLSSALYVQQQAEWLPSPCRPVSATSSTGRGLRQIHWLLYCTLTSSCLFPAMSPHSYYCNTRSEGGMLLYSVC